LPCSGCSAICWPLLVALVMAYLLEWPVSRLQRAVSRTVATSLVLLLFITVTAMMLLGSSRRW
jgi:putative permease